MSFNKVTIFGYIGRDPEMRDVKDTKVTKFSVATVLKTGEVKRTDWHSVVVWGRLAETCSQYLKKGSRVLVDGRLQTSSWEKDGIKHYRTEIVAQTVHFVDRKSEDMQAQDAQIDMDAEFEKKTAPFVRKPNDLPVVTGDDFNF